MHHSGPFTIPEIRGFVPEKVKPWILIVFFVIYQFSGGVYMAAVCEMSGSLALMQEDILMAGYASLVGLALTFTIMLRLKFRFSAKTSLAATALGLIACNLICMHTSSVPLLVAACFVAGIFRMWGTFACNSAIQLWVTPKRDMAVWFCYIQLCVQGFLQLSGLTVIYVAFFTQWEYMHGLIIGLLLCLLLITVVLFRNQRTIPMLSLFGIDWMGALLWGGTILCAIFVLNYGSYYDWYQSRYIWMGTVFGMVALALNLWRASFIRHPYISNQTWCYRNVWLTFVLYFVLDILVSPSHELELIYRERILGYDSLNLISLNWIVLLGFVCGAFFTYRVFALGKSTYKTMTLIGFSLVVGYLLVMYFIIDYSLPQEMLVLPLLLRGCGYIIIVITFITALSTTPFQHFWQSLTVQAFASACCGSLVGSAILTHVLKLTVKKNAMLLGAALDNVNPAASRMPSELLWGSLQQQATIVSMKEIYGWLCLLGIFCLLAFLLRESSLRPQALHPKFSTIRHAIKHQLKMDRMED
jgi:MFS transporter, DHA2 family, multidrug resistance protein